MRWFNHNSINIVFNFQLNKLEIKKSCLRNERFELIKMKNDQKQRMNFVQTLEVKKPSMDEDVKKSEIGHCFRQRACDAF